MGKFRIAVAIPRKVHADRKRDAQYQVTLAITRGELVPPPCCSHCSRRTRVVGHHHDYSKPLDVVWLCRWCHMDVHHKGLRVRLPSGELSEALPPPPPREMRLGPRAGRLLASISESKSRKAGNRA